MSAPTKSGHWLPVDPERVDDSPYAASVSCGFGVIPLSHGDAGTLRHAVNWWKAHRNRQATAGFISGRQCPTQLL